MNANDPIYLDNQASTPVLPHVREAMLPFLGELFGNPHSNDHFFGWTAKKAVDDARNKIASFVQADADEIVFTSGASEANNLAILGNAAALQKKGKRKVLVSAFEHKCVLESAKAAAHLHNLKVEFIQPTQNGLIDPDVLASQIDDEVGLVSIMTVNNEIGTIQPIKDLCRVAHGHNALFHTDAAQAGVFLEIDVTDSEVDMLSLSGHKIYGPKGIGCLYIRRDRRSEMAPIIYGGGQEAGLRSGTLPVMLCVGFGEACTLAASHRVENREHLQRLSDMFLSKLTGELPDTILNGDASKRHPGNLNLRFPGVDAHSLLQALQPNVAASTGSACTTGTPEPSYVLRAIGIPSAAAAEALRFSFGLQNTDEHIARATTLIVEAVKEFRELSPALTLHSN
ncbi:MAG: cysteine desulfurase family protein [Bdellovibrionales bacterium]